MGYVRTPLVSVRKGTKSSYQSRSAGGGVGGPRDTLIDLSTLSAGKCPQDVADAQWAADQDIIAAGGDPRHTGFLRSTEAQAEGRKKYERWLDDGKPTGAAYDKKIHKNAFVSKPGRSFHASGRGNDRHIIEKDKNGKTVFKIFPNEPDDMQLDILWPILKKHGIRPIIKSPDETKMENWHFDTMGEWAPVYDRLGYEQAAICAALDTGVDIYDRWEWKFIQAQLHRAGYDCGEVDGWPGSESALEGKLSKTRRALQAAGLLCRAVNPERLFKAVSDLPSSPKVVWRPE